LHEEAAPSQVPALPPKPSTSQATAPPRFHPHSRRAPFGARCTLGSEPTGCCHLLSEIEALRASTQSPGRGGSWFLEQVPARAKAVPQSCFPSRLPLPSRFRPRPSAYSPAASTPPHHPQAVHEHSQLACHRHLRTPARVLPSSFGQQQSPASQLTVSAEGAQNVIGTIDEQPAHVAIPCLRYTQLLVCVA
jgi:hypothetical protein